MQRAKVGSSYSDWFKFTQRIPQSSKLGPLHFNIFYNDIFFEIQKSNIFVAKTYNQLLKTSFMM